MINRQRNRPQASTRLLFLASKELRDSFEFALKGRGLKPRRKCLEIDRGFSRCRDRLVKLHHHPQAATISCADVNDRLINFG
jgi:hypothetical protein